MATTAAILDPGFILLLALIYALVTWRLGTRHSSSPANRRAIRMFELWWGGIATLFAAVGTSGMLRASGIDAPALHATLVVASMVALCLGLWGILHYVTYLYSGRSLFVPYMLYYAGILAALAYGLAMDPSQGEAWRLSVTRLVILTGPWLTGVIVAFLLPVIVACGFYFSLWFRVHEPEKRFRIGSISLAFLLWFGSAILAAATGIADEGWWAIVGRGIGLVSSGLVLLAHWPPRSLVLFVRRGQPSP